MCVCVCVGQLYPSLCELAHVLSVDGPVKQRLDTLAGELAKAADKELQVCWRRHGVGSLMQPYFKQSQHCGPLAFKLLIKSACLCVRCRYADFKRNVAFKFIRNQQLNIFLPLFTSSGIKQLQCSRMIKSSTPWGRLWYFALTFYLVEHN